jgi:hypothetical protein
MSLVGKSIYPLDLVENTIKKFNVSLTQNYINQVVNYFAKTQDINLTFDFYYNLLKDSKQYFTDNEIDKAKQKKLFKDTVDYHLTQNYYDKKIKEPYKTDYAVWLPSSSPRKTASIEHIANYGKVFKIGKGINGDYPSKRKNCRCGIKILNSNELADYGVVDD